MTGLLVSVASPEEARVALDNGATVIDGKDPLRGALAALPASVLKTILTAVGDRATVTAAGGDAPSLLDLEAIADSGVAYLKVPVPAGDTGAGLLSLVGRQLGARTKLVAVFAADREPDLDLVPVAAMAGFSGVMLDTFGKTAGLTAVMETADIARFVASARRSKLMVGLAGSLRVVDVGTLLPLQPDLLGFRGGVCEGEDRTKPLDPARIRAVAAAIKVHAAHRLPVA